MDPKKMPYVKPSLETIDVKTLTEAVGPAQALSSGVTSNDLGNLSLKSNKSSSFGRR